MFPVTAKRIAARVRRFSAVASFLKLARCEDASAGIEFAVVATPFLALLFAIMETALLFLANQTLETAAQNAGRLILTGQAQNQGYGMQSFQQAVCSSLASFFNCNNVLIDVRTVPNFSSANTCAPVQNGQIQNNFGFTPGNPGDIVVVRVMYQWPVYVSLLGLSSALAGNMSNSNALVMATASFRNEPYQPTPPQ
jgi:Flp pilus assembly protein TadG